jgi:hypothetical protein
MFCYSRKSSGFSGKFPVGVKFSTGEVTLWLVFSPIIIYHHFSFLEIPLPMACVLPYIWALPEEGRAIVAIFFPLFFVLSLKKGFSLYP